MSMTLKIARHVRDTDSWQHTLGRLCAQFGRYYVQCALENGVIERQRWQGEETDYIDLTRESELLLIEAARGPRPMIVTGR